MRLWPKSLLGQVLIAATAALLVAQSVSAVLLYRAAENRRETAMLNAIALQLARQAEPRIGPEDRPGRGRMRGTRLGGDPIGRLPRPIRLEWSERFSLAGNETRHPRLESELGEILTSLAVPVDALVVTKRTVGNDDFIRSRPRIAQRLMRRGRADRPLIVAALQREGSSEWAIARVPLPRGPNSALRTILFQTFVIFVILLGSLYLLLRRITRPLGLLTARTEQFAGAIGMQEPLAPEGPEDLRQLIAAHNAMEARIVALLDEKDVMLGAIGHDLKTPLSALRVRIEAVEDDAERARMADSIDDISRSLDDILSLARVGRTGDPPENAELSALVSSVVEEFEDMGKPVQLGTVERGAQPVHVTWLKRGLRNLIANAVRYGGNARVSLLRSSSATILRVDDDGPGIPPDSISAMLEPFTRGENSRNRATGGAGLGLTLARAIAEQHGGELVLANRDEGGLRAEIRLPLSAMR